MSTDNYSELYYTIMHCAQGQLAEKEKEIKNVILFNDDRDETNSWAEVWKYEFWM